MAKKGSKSERIRSALFVDFDNIFIRFQKEYNDNVADSFASSPEKWVGWIEQEVAGISEEGNPICRKLLVRSCYMNPQKFSKFRCDFTKSGFDVIDCPPLTDQGKTSTDMHVVIDALDALAHPVHLDEFIILSGDADFTPLLRRLRRHDRLTTIFSAGPASAAYVASCDSMISVDKFISQALGITKVKQINGSAMKEDKTGSVITPDVKSDIINGEKVVRIKKCPKLNKQENCKPTHSPMEDLISKIFEAIEIPALSREQYTAIFESLACEINSNGFDMDTTNRNVQVLCSKNGITVMENDVDTVIESCNRSGHWFTMGIESADSIAEGYRKYITELCLMKGIRLNGEELESLSSWITGMETQPPADTPSAQLSIV